MFQAPYYNRSVSYNICDFQSHYMQSLIALFMDKKYADLLSRIKNAPKFCREDIFFDEFTRFISKYVKYETLPIDVVIYFRSSSEQKPGTQLGVGGTGNKSNSYAKSFKTANVRSNQCNKAMTEYFETKYRAHIRDDKDERRFLGEKHIWDKVAMEEYVMPAIWREVVETGYDDETLTKPIPYSLDKNLVPLDIRNRVVQKYKSQMNSGIRYTPNPITNEEPEELVPSPIKLIVVDAETQKMLDDEGW
jgi:hypothetical protein